MTDLASIAALCSEVTIIIGAAARPVRSRTWAAATLYKS